MLTESLQSESLSDTTLESRLVTYASTTPAHAHKILTILVRVTKVLDDDIPVLHGTWAGHHPNNTQFTPFHKACRQPPPHHVASTSPPRPPHPPVLTPPTPPTRAQVPDPSCQPSSRPIPPSRGDELGRACHAASDTGKGDSLMFMLHVHVHCAWHASYVHVHVHVHVHVMLHMCAHAALKPS